MSENENIEAKLCSYIEGDLDAEGRAEIEKYLLAHPQYRPLIAQLSRTRGLVRGLPRASAPSELLETLSGQIERSALLGDDDPGSMRINSRRTPQLAAWAAVLVLMAGLAAVIYRVLPSNKTQPELALLKPAPEASSATQALADESQKSVSELDKSRIAQTPTVAGAAAPGNSAGMVAATAAPVPTSQQLAAAMPMPSSAADTIAEPAPAIASASSTGDAAVVTDGTSVTNGTAQRQLGGSFLGADATQQGQNLYVTLRATDAKAAGVRITQYLNDNGIVFESQSINSSARISAGPLGPLLPSGSFGASATNSVVASTPPGAAFSPAAKRSVAPLESDALGAKRMFTRERSIAEAPNGSAQMPRPEQDSGDVIVAHNLTPDQAKRLTSDFAVKFAPADGNSAPSLQPIAMDQTPLGGESRLQSGERVRIIARDNGLPGVEAMNEPQTIDADGNVTLPMVGKVKAAGLTQAELAEKIPRAYRDAKSPTTATWTIDRIADIPSPATQPTLSLVPSSLEAARAAVSATTAPSDAPLITGALDSGPSNKDRNTDRQPSAGGFGFGGGGIGNDRTKRCAFDHWSFGLGAVKQGPTAVGWKI